ncbi:hypothetical protein CBL_10391 [Carabus blaptoides fortunei]
MDQLVRWWIISLKPPEPSGGQLFFPPNSQFLVKCFSSTLEANWSKLVRTMWDIGEECDGRGELFILLYKRPARKAASGRNRFILFCCQRRLCEFARYLKLLGLPVGGLNFRPDPFGIVPLRLALAGLRISLTHIQEQYRIHQ